MNDLEVNGICLYSKDYKENDKIVTLCALEKGKINLILRGVRSQKSKLKYAASPLCFAHYSAAEKNGTYICTGCECHDSFYGIWSDPIKYCAASTVLETLDAFVKTGNDFDTVILNALHYLKELCYSKFDLNELNRFLFQVFSQEGNGLELDRCVVCAAAPIGLSFDMGGMICAKHTGKINIKVSESVLAALKNDKQQGFEEADAREAFLLLRKYYYYLTEKSLKSAAQLCAFLGDI